MLIALVTAVVAAQTPTQVIEIQLKDHRFSPAAITAKAGFPIRIELRNDDPAMEEFDSLDLGIERDVTPHGKISIVLPPQKPGAYRFMGELHAKSAIGELTVTP